MPRRWRHRQRGMEGRHVRTTGIVQSRGRLEGGSAAVGRLRARSPRFGEFRPADNSVPLREEFERRIAFLERVARARTRQTNKLIAIYTGSGTGDRDANSSLAEALSRFDATRLRKRLSYPREILSPRRNRATTFTNDMVYHSSFFEYKRYFTRYSVRGFRGILSERLGV